MKDYKLISIEESDLPRIFEIYSKNEDYFLLSEGAPATKDSILEDMKKIPPNTLAEQKHYKAISYEDEIIGVIDYVLKYPDVDTVYVGLLIIDKALQGMGHGRRVMKEIEDEGKNMGFQRIRLGVIKNNESGFRFWKSIGYTMIKEVESSIHPEKKWSIIVMEKNSLNEV